MNSQLLISTMEKKNKTKEGMGSREGQPGRGYGSEEHGQGRLL